MKREDLAPYLKQEITVTLPLGAVLGLASEPGQFTELVEGISLVAGTRVRPILPAIGADFEGGTFAGVTLADDALAGLVLLPDPAQDIDWLRALEWAKGRDAIVPSRIDHLILLKNLRDRFRTDTYYWSSEEVAGDPEYAWDQSFSYGTQSLWRKSYELHAVAVRRVTL